MGRYHSKTSLLEINAPCLETKAVGRRNGIWPTPEPNSSYTHSLWRKVGLQPSSSLRLLYQTSAWRVTSFGGRRPQGV